MNQATAQPQQPSRTLPIWASILTILLSLGLGGWVVYWYVYKSVPPKSQQLAVREVAPYQGRPFNGGPMRPRMADNGITAQGENAFTVLAANARMAINTQNNNYRFFYNSYDFIPLEQYDTFKAARNLVRNEDVAKKLNITTEQVKKLSPVTTQVGMRLSDADRQELITLWGEYNKSKDNAAQAKLISMLTTVGLRSLDPTRAEVARRVGVIKTILSEEQVKKAIEEDSK